MASSLENLKTFFDEFGKFLPTKPSKVRSLLGPTWLSGKVFDS